MAKAGSRHPRRKQLIRQLSGSKVQEDGNVMVVAKLAGSGDRPEIDGIEPIDVGEVQDQPQWPVMPDRLNEGAA